MALDKNSQTHHIELSSYENSIKVPSMSLDDLIYMFGSIDLLKMDIEGSEYEVLSNCNSLSQVNFIVAELHPINNYEAKLKKILTSLKNTGFEKSILRPPPHGFSYKEVLKRVLYTTNLGFFPKSFLFLTSFLSRLYPHKIRLLYAWRI
jgi:hypothetical protein